MLAGEFKMLTFDCYGTLIDWDSGIRGALQSLMDLSGLAVGPEEVYAAFIETEAGLEKASYRRYAEILQEVVVGLGDGRRPLGTCRDPEARFLGNPPPGRVSFPVCPNPSPDPASGEDDGSQTLSVGQVERTARGGASRRE